MKYKGDTMNWLDNITNLFLTLGHDWQVKSFVAGLITIFSLLFGQYTVAFTALLILMACDLVASLVVLSMPKGFWGGIKEGYISATVGTRKTTVKFLAYSLMLIAAHQVEVVVAAVPVLSGFQQLTIAYLVVNELISVLNHISKMTGQRMNPFGLPRLLSSLRGQEDSKEIQDKNESPDLKK